MAGPFLSGDWYRVASLKPRVRRQVDFHRQIFRGMVWVIVQDHQSGKFNRLTPQGHYLFGRMNGERTLQSLWQDACARFPDDPPTQGDAIQLLSQLYQADLIAADATPDLTELSSRSQRLNRQKTLAHFRNPLALRLPLLDPNAFLERTKWLVTPIFTRWFMAFWVCFILTALVLVVLNWPALTQSAGDQILTGSNIALILCAYPLVKVLHELGHAYATKWWGGEVREIGLMLLIFMPVPYVDASQATAFGSKWQRVVVGAAGILVELTLAAIALIFWLNAEPGIAKAFAYNVMLIGGVSTLLFNGNPLLRFDGYFILSDLLEIPNMGPRANKYFWYLCQRHLLFSKNAVNPATSSSEPPWLVFYAVASFLYRLIIMIAISLFVASRFFVFGLLLAALTIFTAFVYPIGKGIYFVFFSPSLGRTRGKGLLVCAGLLGATLLVLFMLPMPYATVVHGVIWPDSRAILRSEAEGFVASVDVDSGQSVVASAPVLHLTDPILAARINVAVSSLRQLELETQAASLLDGIQASILGEQIAFAQQELTDLQLTESNLILRAPDGGHVYLPNIEDLVGRLVRKGEAVGYIWPVVAPTLRIAVGQDQAELVRNRTQSVDFILQRDRSRAYPAQLSAAVPEGSMILPSKALATSGGGDIVSDPNDPEGLRAIESLFQFEISPVAALTETMIGERAIVRFSHGAEPYGYRALRGLRQLFLRHFSR